jgi:hypothetical protein
VRPVRVSAFVPAPPDQVLAYVSDTRNDPEWCPNVGPVTQVGGSGVEVGARFEFIQTVSTPRGVLESPVTVEVTAVGDDRSGRRTGSGREVQLGFRDGDDRR